MMSGHRKWLFCASFCCAILLAGHAVAARPYARLSFAFDAPAQLKVGNEGNTLVLMFDTPVRETREDILAKAGNHASDVTISEGGKRVVITLDASYRTRQFTSGNKVGLDILTGDEPDGIAPAAAPAAAPPPVPALSEPVPEEKPAEAASSTSIMSTKQEAEADTSSIMTTKEPEPEPVTIPAPAPAPAPEVQAEPAPAAQSEPSVAQEETPQEPVAAPAVAAGETAPAATEEAAAQETPTAEEPMTAGEAPAADHTFMVSTKEAEGGIWINFPWSARVAAATVERGGDIWIVFSRPQPVNTALLRSVMPKSIVNIEQFYSDTHTILRLTTDGTMHVIARQPKDSYRWHMLVSQRKGQATIDTTVTGQSDDEENTYLLLGLFGSGKPVSFYDPRVGDRFIIVPTYEEGHGISNLRSFPGIRLLPSQQGVTVASLRDDLVTDETRVGLKISGRSSLSVSRNLPTLTTKASPARGAEGSGGVLMPYDKWYVPPGEYLNVHTERLRNLAAATPAARPDAMYAMVTLALSQGYVVEALGHLNLIRAQYADYYKANQLALLHAACNLLLNRIKEASEDIAATELEITEELQLWRDAIGLFSPAVTAPVIAAEEGEKEVADEALAEAAQKGTLSNAGADITNEPPPPSIVAAAREFDFIGYNQQYIRFYPPVVRQRLAILAAEYYFKNNEPEKAIAVFDTLNRDNILAPIQLYAELALGKTAAKKNQAKQATDIFGRLAAQYDDRYIQSQARYEDVILKYRNGLLTPTEAEEELEHVRMSWRGDPFERKILMDLASIYSENKQYDNTLRVWKYLLTAFPGDPDTLQIALKMNDLFQELFLGGEADAMEPLKALALFYEFRELTPVGDKGDEIIQKLADRLAAVDLLDRAAQLLEHQVKFRTSGEQRARIGARLALISLLNQEPARALEVLQTTNYGNAPRDLQLERQQLTAQALSRLGKHTDALVMLYNDTSREGGLLRLDILWAMKDWSNIINQAEDLLAERPNLTEPLTADETMILLKLALAYNFEGDYTQLGYLRDYYIALVPEIPMKEIFSFLTNDTAPIDTEDFDMVTRQIANTESFLDLFKKKIASGRLSDTMNGNEATPKS